MIRRLSAWLRSLDPRHEAEAELDEELSYHLEQETARLIRRGFDPERARLEARRTFGSVAWLKDESRQAWGLNARTRRYLTDLTRDIRHACRMFAHRFGFTLTAIVPLALGIGAATSMYSVVDGVMLRPLPFARPDELVAIWGTEDAWKEDQGRSIDWNRVVLGKADYTALAERSRTLSKVAVWGRSGGMLADGSGAFSPVRGIIVSATMLDVLGVRPLLGRTFRPDEAVRNGSSVAMLSFEAWQRSFAGDSAIVGRSISYDEKQWTVIGILPPGTRVDRAGAPPSIWIPAFQSEYDDVERHNRNYRVLGRLAPGATIEAASEEAGRIIAAVKTEWKGSPEGTSGRALSYQDDQTASIRPSLIILSAAVGLLMLIACVNLSILLFGEAARRQPEIAARTALGAGPGRLVRQLLTESMVIAAGGALLGSLAGWGLTRVLIAMAPRGIPGLLDVHFDLRVFGFTTLCAAVAGLVSGVLPVFALLRWGSYSLIGGSGRQTARGELVIHRALVGAEVALSLVMLVGCALLGRSLIRLSEVDPGFNPHGLVTVELTAPRSLWWDSAAVVSFTGQAVRELAAIPGVASVSGANGGLFNGSYSSSPIKVVGRPEDQVLRTVQQRVVLPEYFHTLGVPLVAGRDFSKEDNASSTRVAIISQAEVRRDFPTESPLGQRVTWQGQEWTVIGVAADVHYNALDTDFQPTIYIPSLQWAGNWMQFMVRATGTADGTLLFKAIKQRLSAVNPTIGFAAVDPVPTLVQRSYGEEKYRAMLGSLFGVVGTVLAAFGMFGVISRTVARRMREAGIRAALGAPSKSLTRLMLRETVIGATIGVAVGVPLAAWLARGLTPYLFGIGSLDPIAYFSALAVFALAALVATVPPARRAGRVDPVQVLKAE